MRKKYYNDAFIGNEKITCSFTKYGELLRLYYPTPDYRQYFDFFHVGIKVNDSNIIYLHKDVNNSYNQYYEEDSNILHTEIYNSYFKLNVKQTDFTMIDDDVIVKKYAFTNNSDDVERVNFLVHSKMMSSFNNMAGGMLRNDVLFQYCHNYTVAIFSDEDITSSQMNNVNATINSGIIHDKDYISMSSDNAISYDLGNINPGDTRFFNLFICLKNEKNTRSGMMNLVQTLKKVDIDIEYTKALNYWKNFLYAHDTLRLKNDGTEYMEKLINIYKRTILFIPFLVNEETAGISATLEVDEERDESGRYSYCWPRDAIMMYSYFDVLNFDNYSNKYYEIFLRNTQLSDGIWEQRYFTDCTLAPCWGYQIDETAIVVWGAYKHYLNYLKKFGSSDDTFLLQNVDMLDRAMTFINKYVECKFLNINCDYKNAIYKHETFDLWENNEGISIYATAAIYGAYDAMVNIYKILNKYQGFNDENVLNKIKDYENKKIIVKNYVLENFVDKQRNIFIRNFKDRYIDISMLGTIIPFEMFDVNDEVVRNTVDEINNTLRTYSNGYLRFQNDTYISGTYPWVIATAWMGMYYKKIGNMEEYKKCMEVILKSSTPLGLLPEQISSDFTERWVIGLGWSHAMFIGLISE